MATIGQQTSHIANKQVRGEKYAQLKHQQKVGAPAPAVFGTRQRMLPCSANGVCTCAERQEEGAHQAATRGGRGGEPRVGPAAQEAAEGGRSTCHPPGLLRCFCQAPTGLCFFADLGEHAGVGRDARPAGRRRQRRRRCRGRVRWCGTPGLPVCLLTCRQCGQRPGGAVQATSPARRSPKCC